MAIDDIVALGAAMGRKFMPAFKAIYINNEFVGFRIIDLDFLKLIVDAALNTPEKPLSEEVLVYQKQLIKLHPDKARSLIHDFSQLLEYVNAAMPYKLDNSSERESMLKDLWDTKVFPKYALLLAHLRQ